MFKRILIGIVLAAAGGVIKQQMGNPSTARSMPDFSLAFSQFVGSSSPVTHPAASSPVQQNVPLGENLTTVIVGNKKFIVPKAAEDDAAPTSAGGHDQRGLVAGVGVGEGTAPPIETSHTPRPCVPARRTRFAF
jgi:hypothetical protein